MSFKKVIKEKCDSCYGNKGGTASNGAVYCIGIFGAAFYFFPKAIGITGFIMAILKSLAWPALLVYQALTLMNLPRPYGRGFTLCKS